MDARILLVEDDPSIREVTAIGRLRSKIEEDPVNPRLILTMRGSGYKAARPG